MKPIQTLLAIALLLACQVSPAHSQTQTPQATPGHADGNGGDAIQGSDGRFKLRDLDADTELVLDNSKFFKDQPHFVETVQIIAAQEPFLAAAILNDLATVRIFETKKPIALLDANLTGLGFDRAADIQIAIRNGANLIFSKAALEKLPEEMRPWLWIHESFHGLLLDTGALHHVAVRSVTKLIYEAATNKDWASLDRSLIKLGLGSLTNDTYDVVLRDLKPVGILLKARGGLSWLAKKLLAPETDPKLRESMLSFLSDFYLAPISTHGEAIDTYLKDTVKAARFMYNITLNASSPRFLLAFKEKYPDALDSLGFHKEPNDYEDRGWTFSLPNPYAYEVAYFSDSKDLSLNHCNLYGRQKNLDELDAMETEYLARIDKVKELREQTIKDNSDEFWLYYIDVVFSYIGAPLSDYSGVKNAAKNAFIPKRDIIRKNIELCTKHFRIQKDGSYKR